jgi:lipoprotein-anchoring transpeptidase ErfK/SrfK
MSASTRSTLLALAVALFAAQSAAAAQDGGYLRDAGASASDLPADARTIAIPAARFTIKRDPHGGMPVFDPAPSSGTVVRDAQLEDAAARAARLKPGQFEWIDAAPGAGHVLTVIDLAGQRATVYRGGRPIAVTTVSTGTRSHPTPTGVFPILQKKAVHHSRKYDNAPMPFMQRLTWDGIALHAGKLPGYPASHGCVRLPKAFAERLFRLTKTGQNVVIAEDGSADALMRAGLPAWVALQVGELQTNRALAYDARGPADSGFGAP